MMVDIGRLRAVLDRLGAAEHVIASEGMRAPESFADAFTVLGENAVLDGELSRSMADAARFRNLLVHQYADVDDGRVVATLDRLGDLERFLREVAVWLDRQPG